MTIRNTSTPRTAAVVRWALWLTLSFTGLAMAQGESTLDQVYQAAQAGRVEQALEMMQPVLKAHPGSAKAHYVEAELLARLGQASQARDQLAQAEKLAPGLPFAKADSVQNLRHALASPQAGRALAPAHLSAVEAPPAPAKGSSMPWGVVLAVAGGALVAWMLMRLGRPAASPNFVSAAAAPAPTAPAVPAVPAGWSVPGMNTSMPANMGAPAPSGGLGRQVVGGLATGLAVGAGVMAAESIGRNLFGGPAHAATAAEHAGPAGYDPVFGNAGANPDLGGQDFGIADASSWDDSAVGGGSSDWDT